MMCIYSLRKSYILILPKLFYLQTSVKFQQSYIGRQASCLYQLVWDCLSSLFNRRVLRCTLCSQLLASHLHWMACQSLKSFPFVASYKEQWGARELYPDLSTSLLIIICLTHGVHNSQRKTDRLTLITQ